MSSLLHLNRRRNRHHRKQVFALESLERREMLTVATEVVADIRPGNRGSSIGQMFEYQGELFFSADDGVSGSELWKSDGTRGGTELVREIRPGDEGSIPGWFVEYQDELFFAAISEGRGDELWKTDGTSTGTSLVRDINPGESDSFPAGLILFNDEIYFSASDGQDNDELWKSDGTENGTAMVADIRPGRSSAPGNFSGFYEFDGFLYFNARDNTNGVELYRSDGTVEGTTLVIDADLGDSSSWPTNFVEFQGDLYFLAEVLDVSEDKHFYHLFRVNHDEGTATQVSDVRVDFQQGILATEDGMYFAGESGETGFELYRSDGTEAGTRITRDIRVGNGDSDPRNFFEYQGDVYFVAGDSADSDGKLIYTLWTTDGTPFGTRKVSADTVYEQTTFVVYQDELYFTGRNEEVGWELFKTDGTPNGTVLVQDIEAGPADSQALPKIVFDGRLLMIAETERDGWEIWAYDGTTATMVETHQGSGDFTEDPDAFRFTEFGDDLVYVGSNPFDGAELNIIRSTGLPPETPRLAGDADGNGTVEFADFLILSNNWGKQDAIWADGDFDENGVVEFADFLILSDNFGTSIAAALAADRVFAR